MSVSYNFYQRVAIGVTTGLFALTTFVVYMRLYIRCILLKAGSAGWDDLTVFIAWIMALGASIATYFEVISGLGRHIQELSPEQLYNFELSLFIVIQFYNVGLNTVKISFLSQYHRLFPDTLIRRICFFFGMFCFFWMFAQAVLYAFSCVPITGLVPSMKVVCVPTLPTWTAISSLNVFTDLLIFCIPLKPLWGMPLLKRQRYLLIGIFCVGFLICIISIIRIPTLRRGAASPDPSFTNVTTALWSLAELDTAILCTSLPILRPLVARFVRGVAPADAPAGRLKAGPERPEEEEPPRRRSHKLPGESLLYDTGLSGSTLQSGGRSFLRSLLSSGTRSRDRDRDRDRDAEAELHEDHRRAVPTTTTTITTIEVDAPKGSCDGPLDSPAGAFRKPPVEKMVPRPPLTFYPRTYPSNNKLPPVPAIPPPPPMGSRDPPRKQPSSPAPTMTVPASPRRDDIATRNKPLYYAPTPTTSPPPRRPASADDAGVGATRPTLSPGDSFAGTLPHGGTPPPGPNAGTRHQKRPSHLGGGRPPTPRGDSFTLPLAGAATPPRGAQQQQAARPASSQVCSRCASLTRRPMPQGPGSRDGAPPPRGSWIEDEDKEEDEEEEEAGKGRSRGRVATRSAQTQTVVTWDSFAGAGGRVAQAQVRVRARAEEEEGCAQRGRVTSGQGVVVRAVDVGAEDRPRSWRGQVVVGEHGRAPSGDRGTWADGEGRRERGREEGLQQRQQRQQDQHDTDDSSSVDEILPRSRPDGEDDASGLGMTRRSDSGRRVVGTSWLRLSTG